MVTLKGLLRTLTSIRNPHSAILSKLTNKPVKIIFSNGSKFVITWSQFRFLRDNYNLVKKYNLQQIDTDTFKINTERFQLIGSQVLICTLDEIESGIYDYDYKGKVVLDIGGFEGDSAVFFWAMGAKKVIIYEPVLEHNKYIQENVRLNNIKAEVHNEGIGSEDGEVTVAYKKVDNCFGLEAESLPNKMQIKIKDVAKVISESDADVAKIDCEGAEVSLVKVPNEVLRKIEYAIIEVHTLQIRVSLIQKFKSAGFIIAKGTEECYEPISMLYFKRV